MLMDGGKDRQTKDRQKVITIAHPKHSSGELKMAPLDSRFFAFKKTSFQKECGVQETNQEVTTVVSLVKTMVENLPSISSSFNQSGA